MSTMIIVFEGLGLVTPSHVKRGLLDRLTGQADFDTQVWRGSFMSSGPVRDWDCDKVIVMGHSMGVASAIAWCNRKAPKIEIDLLLTLDGRPLHRPYVKPQNVKRAVNFYRNSWWMCGYPVEGAENHVVTCGHTSVPALPEVLKVLRESL